MLLLGIDIGTSSIKVSVVDASTQQTIAQTTYPDQETAIISPQPGWAEQSPDQWWHDVQQAILKLHAQKKYDPAAIRCIGIAYQMHGLVLVDKEQQSIRNSIIWCDSRAVETGDKAFHAIGMQKCLTELLNSPANFTASKLAWVKEHEPAIYERIDKVMLPGDFIAMKLTGHITTTPEALSEGIFWDFKRNEISNDILDYFGFERTFFPEVKNVFDEHGIITDEIASKLSLPKNISVSYKSGDQPNNALSLNVLGPGEVAATAGTSGVIYAVDDKLHYDQHSRVNTFAHVNHQPGDSRLGVLLCINGTGILNRWIKNMTGTGLSYHEVNEAAAKVPPGSDGLIILPFGNGAERMLQNKTINAHFLNLDLNIHQQPHLYRAAQEGIAFAFRYGLDIMRENGLAPAMIRAGRTNMFLSDVFTDCFVNALDTPVELYETDGSAGAAKGAGIGAKIFHHPAEAFSNFKAVKEVLPSNTNQYNDLYMKWRECLQQKLTH